MDGDSFGVWYMLLHPFSRLISIYLTPGLCFDISDVSVPVVGIQIITPRSYGSETATTRSSPDRSRNCSMRLSSHGAFNPLSNRSVRSGISSSRSLLSLSSLGAVLNDGKDNVSFASEMPSEASTAISNRAQVDPHKILRTGQGINMFSFKKASAIPHRPAQK